MIFDQDLLQNQVLLKVIKITNLCYNVICKFKPTFKHKSRIKMNIYNPFFFINKLKFHKLSLFKKIIEKYFLFLFL